MEQKRNESFIQINHGLKRKRHEMETETKHGGTETELIMILVGRKREDFMKRKRN